MPQLFQTEFQSFSTCCQINLPSFKSGEVLFDAVDDIFGTKISREICFSCFDVRNQFPMMDLIDVNNK